MAVNSFKGWTVRPQYPAISIVSLVPEPGRHCPTSRSRCPSNEAAGNHSTPARFLFRDGGRLIFPCAHRTTTIHPSDPSRLTSLPFHRAGWSILDCARRTSTFRACAFREQEDGQAVPVFPRGVSHVTEFALLALTLAVEAAVGIGRAFMRVVLACRGNSPRRRLYRSSS